MMLHGVGSRFLKVKRFKKGWKKGMRKGMRKGDEKSAFLHPLKGKGYNIEVINISINGYAPI